MHNAFHLTQNTKILSVLHVTNMKMWDILHSSFRLRLRNLYFSTKVENQLKLHSCQVLSNKWLVATVTDNTAPINTTSSELKLQCLYHSLTYCYNSVFLILFLNPLTITAITFLIYSQAYQFSWLASLLRQTYFLVSLAFFLKYKLQKFLQWICW